MLRLTILIQNTRAFPGQCAGIQQVQDETYPQSEYLIFEGKCKITRKHEKRKNKQAINVKHDDKKCVNETSFLRPGHNLILDHILTHMQASKTTFFPAEALYPNYQSCYRQGLD